MALQFSIRKDLLSGASPMRNAPSTIQASAPTFSARREAFRVPETPKPKLVSQTASMDGVSTATPITRATPTQAARRTGSMIPSLSSDPSLGGAESFARSVSAETERYQPTKAKGLVAELSPKLSRMAEKSTARDNRQTGLRFRTLFGGTDTPGLRASATATDRAWFDAMSDAEKKRAAQIKSPVERGKYINSLDLDNRAISQLRQRQDETAKSLEARASQIGSVRPTDNQRGKMIAEYVKAGSKTAAYDLDLLNGQQKDTIVKLAQGKDYQAVSDYLDAIEHSLREKSRENLAKQNKTLGYEHPVYSIIPEGASNTVNGIPVILSAFYNKVREKLTGEWTPIDPNSHVYDLTAASQAIAEGAEERISEIKSPYAQGAARIARSGASSALTNGLQLLGGGALGLEGAALSNFTLAVMSASASGQTMHRELKGGSTNDEALTNAIASGIIEALTEKVSLDRFTNIFPSLASGTGTARQQAIRWMKEFAIQGGIEGLEEIAGNVLDQTWDILYEGENSEYSRRTQAILAQNILDHGGPEQHSPTPQDVQAAREQAFTGLFVEQSVDAFLSAVFSSMLLTGVPAASGNISKHMSVAKAGNSLKYNGRTNAEILKAEMFPGTEASKLAAELRERVEKNPESVSGYKLGKMSLLTNSEILKTLGEMAESPNADVRNFAHDLINSDELQSKSLTVAGLERIFEVRRRALNAQEPTRRSEAEPAPSVAQTTPTRELEPEPEPTPATAAQEETISAPPPKLTMRRAAPTPVDSERGREQFPYANRYLDAAEPLAPVAEQAQPTRETERRANRGRTYTSDNKPINFRWAVAPAESLIVSNDEYGNKNPAYPAELQPRDRSRFASQLQIDRMSKRLTPERLAESAEAQNGAPIVNENGVVIGGNARSAAIRAAYRSGRANEYADYIRANAERFGIDPASIPENPVLVRVAEGVEDWAALAKDLNVSGTASYSPTETALSDAERIGNIVDLIVPNEKGDLNAPQNREFISQFLAAIPQSESSELSSPDGGLNKSGLQRATNAVFAYAYGDINLLMRFSESLDNDMTNITNALMRTAPRFAQLKVEMQNGGAYNIPIVQTILDGLDLYAEAKKSRQTVSKTLSQAPLDAHWDANAALVAEVIEHFKRSARGVGDFLSDLAEAVEEFGAPDQLSLLGESANVTTESAIDTAISRTNQREGTDFRRGEGQFGGQGVPASENPAVRTESEPGRPDGQSVSQRSAEDVGADAVAPKAERDKADFQETKKRWNDAAQSPDTLAALGVTREVADAMAYFLNNTSIERIDDSPTYPEMDEPYMYWLHGAYDETLSSLLEAYNKTKDPYSGDQFALESGNVYDPTETRKLAGTAHFGAPKLLDFEQYILKQGLLRQEQNAEPAKAQNESANPKTPQREAQTPNEEETERQAPKEQLAEKRRDYSKWETDFTFYEIAKEELDRLPDADEKLDKLARETRQFKTEVMDYFGTIADAPIGSVMIQAQSLAEYWRGFFKRALDSPNVFVNEANGSLDWSNQLIAGTRDSLVQGVFNGLTSSYPDLINASFTLDLENVTIKSKEGARILFDYIRSGHFDDIRKHFMHGMSQTIIDSIDKMYSFESAYQEAKQATLDSLYGYVNALKDSQKSRYKKYLLNTRKGYSVTEAERIRNAIMDGAELSTQRTDSGLSYFMKTDGAKKPEKLSEIAYRFAEFIESQRESQAEAQSQQSQAMDAERNPTITASLPDAEADAEDALPEGTGAAERGFAGENPTQIELERLADRYGEMRPERTDAASRERGFLLNPIPNKTSPGTYVGRNAQNQITAPGIAKERMNEYDEALVSGFFDQQPLTHKGELEKANDLWSKHGNSLQWARKYLLDKANEHRLLTTTDIALFQKALVGMSHTDMSTQDYIEFAVAFNDYASYLGHALNLLKLLRSIDPNFQINTAQRETEKLNEKFAEKGRGETKNKDAPDNERAVRAVDEARDDVLDDLQNPEEAERKRRRRKQRAVRAVDEARTESAESGQREKPRDHGYRVPFWMEGAGDVVADTLIKKINDAAKNEPQTQKQKSVAQAIIQDMLHFADDYIRIQKSKGTSRTAIDRMRDFFTNREQYEEAWRSAQKNVRYTYEQNGEQDKLNALSAFLENPLSRESTGESFTNPVARGVLTAILKSDNRIMPRDIAIRVSLTDTNAVAEQIFQSVAAQIQAPFRDMEGNELHFTMSEQDAKEVRAAIMDYIFSAYSAQYAGLQTPNRSGRLESPLQRRMDSDINAALKDMSLQMAKIIREGNPQKAAVAQRIADMLIQKYGVSQEAAQRAGEIITEQFNRQVAERAEDALRRMFRESKKTDSTTANQDRLLKQFSELANMGAFTAADYKERAAAKIFGYARIEIDPALVEEFRNAETDEERDDVIGKIQQNVADQIPPTLWEKIRALRYMGMLGSLKTIFSRNMGGNLAFQPTILAKNVIAAGIEDAAISLGFKIEKTRTVTYSRDDYKAFADEFGSLRSKKVSEIRRLILQGGKYSDNSAPNTFMQGVQEKRTIFGRNDDFLSRSVGRRAEQLRRAITDAMDWGDAVFAKQTYAATAARYLKAQGVTFQTATQEQLNAARELAVREAAEATYRDNNEFAEAISGLLYRDYHGDSKARLAIRYLGEGIMPFRKTPANIAVRAFEYSPFGIVKSAVDSLTMKYGANRMTGNDLINELAKGLAGTGLFLLGMFMRRRDWLTGTGPLDDMKKRGFMQLEGWQPYSFKFKIGNRFRYYNADWMSPEAIPFFLGANFADALDEERLDFWQGAKIAMTVGDPIIKMSMLSGLNDALADAASYGGTEYALTNFIGKAYWSGLTQMITPQAYLQAARAVNNIRQTTFADKNSSLPAAVQKAIGGFPYPGNPYRMDYIDMWGRTQENYVTPVGNAVAQILSPSYQSIEDIDADTRRMENALMALYDRTGETSVLPSAAQSSFDLNGEKKNMTKAEFAAYATRRGQAAHTLLKELTESSAYSRLNDAQRITAVSNAYSYANQMAKESIWGDADDPKQRFSADSWVAEANDLAIAGIPVSDYICAKAIKSRAKPVQDASGDSVLTKVVWRKNEGGKVKEKKSEISSASIQAALEIRQALQYSGSDAQKRYKLLFKDLDIAESVWGKSEEYLQSKLDAAQKKGASQ